MKISVTTFFLSCIKKKSFYFQGKVFHKFLEFYKSIFAPSIYMFILFLLSSCYHLCGVIFLVVHFFIFENVMIILCRKISIITPIVSWIGLQSNKQFAGSLCRQPANSSYRQLASSFWKTLQHLPEVSSLQIAHASSLQLAPKKSCIASWKASHHLYFFL